VIKSFLYNIIRGTMGKPLYVRVAGLLNEGNSREEIARELSISRRKVRKAIYHAKKQYREVHVHVRGICR